MRNARTRRVGESALTGPRPVETSAERSLRRSQTARLLAAEVRGEDRTRRDRRSAPQSAYHRATRTASLTAAGVLAAMFALGIDGPTLTQVTGAMVMTAANVPASGTLPASVTAFVPTPFGRADFPSMRNDDGITLAAAAVRRPPAPRITASATRASGAAAPSADFADAARESAPLIEIIPYGTPTAGTPVAGQLRPRQRPAPLIEVMIAPGASPSACGFGSIVRRGETAFHRPPACI